MISAGIVSQNKTEQYTQNQEFGLLVLNARVTRVCSFMLARRHAQVEVHSYDRDPDGLRLS